MIKISIKGLAKFMVGNSTQQRKILRDYKYPEPEGHAQATYYREARDLILAFHRKGRDAQWLLDKSANLDALAVQSAGQTKARLSNNARALREYSRHFSGSRFEILPETKLYLQCSGLSVSVIPDLHVREKGKERIIKLEFSKKAPEVRVIKIITQAMYEAQSASRMGLPSSSVLYMDVPRGHTHKGARAGARMRDEIEASCKNISDLWDGI